MLFTFDKSIGTIEILDETRFSDNNILERQHIEKWIEEYPELLGEDLLIISTEYDKFDQTRERLDILTLDRSGRLVVVELKRDDSGKYVDLQAVKYAAYCSTLTLDDVVSERLGYLRSKRIDEVSSESVEKEVRDFILADDFEDIDDRPRIILVSKEFRQEVTATVLWLRNFGLDITCIRLTPYNLNQNSIGVAVNTIIPLPEAKDYQIRAEKKEMSEVKLTKTKKRYLDFWTSIRENFTPEYSLELKRPVTDSYYQINTGVGGVHYEWNYQSNPKFLGVELHFEKGSRKANHDVLSKFDSVLTKLENQYSEEFFIEKEWGKRWSRFGIVKRDVDYGVEDLQFAMDKMQQLISLCQPILDED